MEEEYSLEEIKQIIRSIAISGAVNRLTVKDLARDFKQMEGFDIPYRRLGFRTVDQFLCTLTDTVKIIGSGPAAAVEPIVIQSNKHIRAMVQASKNNRRGRYRLPQKQCYRSYANKPSSNNQQRNVFQNGNSEETKRKVFNPEFDFYDSKDLNGSGSDSSDDMPKFVMNAEKRLEQVHIDSPNPSPEPVVAKVEKTDVAVKSTQDETVQKPTKTMNEPAMARDAAIPDGVGLNFLSALEIPGDAITVGETIPEAKLPEQIAPRDVVRIFVTEVHNPNRFWFHLAENAEKIDEMMNDIETFYSHLSREEWRLKASNAHVGLYCMAKFHGLWHRARIVSEYNHNRLKVFYIDYGTVAEVELREVKFMAKCFAQSPAQALRGSLAFVRPVNPCWTRDASWSMLSLVYEKILHAYVVNVDRQENVLHQVLIDTSDPQDIIVNQQLFVKGHAIWEDDLPYKSKNIEQFGDRIQFFCEQFPRFKDIENGIYPSLHEIGGCQAHGFDFDRYFTQSLQDGSDYLALLLRRTYEVHGSYFPSADEVALTLNGYNILPEQGSSASPNSDASPGENDTEKANMRQQYGSDVDSQSSVGYDEFSEADTDGKKRVRFKVSPKKSSPKESDALLPKSRPISAIHLTRLVR